MVAKKVYLKVLKMRVRCVNCGMIFDIQLDSCFKQSCPGCNSNAYDEAVKKR